MASRWVYNPPGTNQVVASSGNVFVMETPEGFQYDADGNLTQDGRWAYSWDGENRLVAMQTATNVENVVPRMKLDFTYDFQGRRMGKVVSVWSNDDWVAIRTNLFIYDGWNLIAEISNSTTNNSATNLFVWGLDLSGSLQGAGGIGGLVSAVLDGPSSNSTVFYTFDANGNVSDVINGDTGVIAAHYEYSPFGETVVQAGDAQVLALNPYAFSTKYFDRETTLYYYGLRFNNPSLGRFLTRDPLGEVSFVICMKQGHDWVPQGSTRAGTPEGAFLSAIQQPYAYVGNSPVVFVDPLGLCCFDECLGKCVETLDPLNYFDDYLKALVQGTATGLGAPIFKSLVKAMGIRVIVGPGGSIITTPASVISSITNLGCRNWLRTAGDVASGANLIYGSYMAGVTVGCTATCLKDSCAYK